MSIDSVVVDSVTKLAPEFTMLNNSMFLDSAKITGYLNDTIMITPLLNPTFLSLALNSGSILSQYNGLEIEFTDGPPFADSVIIYYLDPELDISKATDWLEPDVASVENGGNGVYHLDVPYDFGYANSTAAGGASDGMQLGDRNWEASNSVSVKPFRADELGLSIYPMPASGQVTINFALQSEAQVSMEIYSMTGQRVAEVMHNRYQSGSHQVSWNSDMLESGMYILRMKAGAQSSTLKMTIQ